MLYVLFTPPDRAKFSEYIPHLLVRAPNQKKAREFAHQRYPSHPLPLVGEGSATFTRCAPLAQLKKLRASDTAKGIAIDVYFAAEDALPLPQVRKMLAQVQWPQKEVSELLLDESICTVEDCPSSGRGGVLARTENITPMIQQNADSSLLFAWRVVSEFWPNPIKDPNMVESGFMKPEITKTQSLASFQEQEAEFIARLMQPQ